MWMTGLRLPGFSDVLSVSLEVFIDPSLRMYAHATQLALVQENWFVLFRSNETLMTWLGGSQEA